MRDPLAADDLVVRPGQDDDFAGLSALMVRCFSDYWGCVLWVDGDVPYIRAIATEHAAKDGRFWVVERGDRLVGSVGNLAKPDGRMELKMLYVHPAARRRGLAARLVGLVEQDARERGFAQVELWSDTRFADAHRLYNRLGFRQTGEVRHLKDISGTLEYYFIKDLT